MQLGVQAGVQAAHDRLPTELPASGYEARERDDRLKFPRARADEFRRDALARARLWLEPDLQGGFASQRDNPG